MKHVPPPVYLHIGAMKTGTTYLQQVLIANRQHLAAAGYLFPGESWSRQVRATQDVLGMTRGDPRIAAESAGAWAALAEEMLAHTGTATVMSMEFMSFARPPVARRVVTSLAPADVHVVLTVRDAVATIPAHWQTNVHNGSTVSWPAFMRGVRKTTTLQGRLGRFSPDAALRAFHRAHGIPRMLRTWGALLPPGRLHVVTVPPSGSDPRLLWERFASVVGLDPDTCPEPPAKTNASLGHASSELLRRVNLELGRLKPTDYNPTLNDYLALQVLAGRDESRARTDLATRRFAVAWNGRVRDAVTAGGAVVTGDLADLPTELPADSAVEREGDGAEPAQAEVLAAGAAAVEGMHRLLRRRARRLGRTGVEVQVPAEPDEPLTAQRWASAPDPVGAAAAEVAGLARVGIDLHRRIRSMRTP